MERTAVVILNYNGAHFLRRFLPTVARHSAGCQLVVADNGSTDDSWAYLQSCGLPIQTLRLPENHGYTGGYNAALRQVDAQYFVLLNSDVEVTAGWISPVIAMMAADATIAAAQPKILAHHDKRAFEYAGAAGGFIDQYGYPFCRGRIFSCHEQDHGQYDDTREIFWATGACLFVRRDVFEEMGGFDEDFFAHMEEIDLCWKMHHAGYKVMYQGQSRVYHVGGGTLPKTNPRKTYLNFRNGLSMLLKHYRPRDLLLRLPVRLLLDAVAAARFFAAGGWADGLAVLRAYGHTARRMPRILGKRKAVGALRKNRQPKTVYPRSIVWDYFVLKKKVFFELRFNSTR